MGEDVPGYREEERVDPNSRTETFVAMKLMIDNWRWEGVPIYIRTGKRLARRVSEVAIQLKNVPMVLFGGSKTKKIEPNVVAMNIQPNEGISVRFESKVPGLGMQIEPVRMDFRYLSAFGPSPPEAYERLVLDAMLGDASLYSRADAVEADVGALRSDNRRLERRRHTAGGLRAGRLGSQSRGSTARARRPAVEETLEKG